MKKLLRSLGPAAAILALAAAPLSAQFTQYVALGDSLTAGVEGGCLVQRNQLASFPAVLANALNQTDFQQPLVQELGLTNPLVGAPCLGAVLSGSSITVGADLADGRAPQRAPRRVPTTTWASREPTSATWSTLTHGDPNGGSTAVRFSALVLRNVPGSPFDGAERGHRGEPARAGPHHALGRIERHPRRRDRGAVSARRDRDSAGRLRRELRVGAREHRGARTDDRRGQRPGRDRDPVHDDGPGATRRSRAVSTPVLGPGNAAYPCEPVAPDHGCPVPDGTLVTLPASALLAQGIGVPVALGGTGQPLPDGQFIPPATVVPGVLLYPDEVAGIEEFIADYNAIIADADRGRRRRGRRHQCHLRRHLRPWIPSRRNQPTRRRF